MADLLSTLAATEAGGAQAAGSTAAGIEPGTRIGRYCVRRRLGTGATGTVVAAFDAKLRREVAIKVLHPRFGGHSKAMARLVREAQALARLNHPNVVEIFEISEQNERVFLVMELVEGQTLRQWLETDPRPSTSEVLEVLIAAGKGLAAAHAEGLVHRDFKPANVMVGSSGRVLVADFGLARIDAGDGADKTSSTDSPSYSGSGTSGSRLRDPELTAHGAIVGTPAYMAPEVLAGESADTYSDQFSFCVAAFEALYGSRPFGQGPATETYDRARLGQVTKGRGHDPICRRIRATLTRGLDFDRSARHESMDLLVGELSSVSRGGRYAPWAIAGTLVTLFGLAASTSDNPQRCTGAPQEIAEIWNDAARDSLRQAWSDFERPFARNVYRHATTEFDSYASSWEKAHREACVATTVLGEQTAADLDLRMACLQRAKGALRAAVEVLASPGADSDGLSRAHEVTSDLPDLRRCSDTAALAAEVEPPDPSETKAVAKLRERIAAAAAAGHLARNEEAQELVDSARRMAATIEYGPVHAELSWVHGFLLTGQGDYTNAEAAFVDSWNIASRWGLRRLTVQASASLVRNLGAHQGRFAEAERYHQLSMRLADGDPTLLKEVRHSWAATLLAQGRAAEAESELRVALAHLGSSEGEQSERAALLSGVAKAMRIQQRYEEGEQIQREVVASFEELLGHQHPEVASSLNILANLLFSQDRFDEAMAIHERALAMRVDAFGTDHPKVAESENNLGVVLRHAGRHADAELHHRRAFEVRERLLGAGHPLTSQSRFNVAKAVLAQGDGQTAERLCQQALASLEESVGAQHPLVGTAHKILGEAHLLQGEYDAAEAELRRALEVYVPRFDPAHSTIVLTDQLLAKVLQRQGRLDEARAAARRALDGARTSLGPEHPTTHELEEALATL